MLILTLRTDKPEAECGLYDNQEQLTYLTWHAHRQLAETLHTTIKEVLSSVNRNLAEVQAILVYAGPGSFTGLRIGIATANALAFSLDIPIIGQSAVGNSSAAWLQLGLQKLVDGENNKQVMPEYGAPVKTTAPRK